MKKISRFVASSVFVVSFCVPFFAAAQINTTIVKGYSDSIIGIINSILVPVLIAIAFITFLWGVYKYFILGAAEPKSREEGQQFVMWGIIGFVIILSLWGIVNLFTSTLGLTASNVPAYPTIGGSTGVTNNTGTVFPGAGTTVGGGTLGNTGGVTAAQSTAYTSLTQQYSAVSGVCGQNGTSSNQCTTARNDYMQSLNAYNATYSGGSATPAVQGVTCTGGQIYDSDTGTCVDSVLKPVVQGVTCTGSEVYDSDTGTCVQSVFSGGDRGGSAYNNSCSPGTSCTTTNGGDGICTSSGFCALNPFGTSGGSSGGSSSTDYGCGPGNGYPDSFGSCSGGSAGSSGGTTGNVDGTYGTCYNDAGDPYPC